MQSHRGSGDTASGNAQAGATASIAGHVARVANGRLSDADTEALRRLFLDNFIVSLWGSTRPWTRQIAQWTQRFAGTGASPVLGGDWSADASVAALVHGTASHSYELDDTHNETLSHPGAAVLPAALAVGAATGASQDKLFRAVAAGYEAMALIGISAGGLETVHRGFHPTAVFGAFGAATASLALYADDRGMPVTADLLVRAWGHALSQASGSMQFSTEASGGEVKRVHAGMAARNGVLAAQFAFMDAVTAPRLVVEGDYGVASLFGGPQRAALPSAALQIHAISLKPYACCRLFHSTIDALAELTDNFSLPAEGIGEIVVSGPHLIADQHMLAEPASTMAAQYSCPYIVGATLRYGPYRYDAYDEAFLEDPAIRRIARMVRFEFSDVLTQYYPAQFATGVRLHMSDGTARSSIVVDSIGTPARPLTIEQILAKGDGLAAHGHAPSIKIRLAERLWDDAQGSRALALALARA
ncbi:MmgE/PrpD family protein [Paraburkholderia silviterrae]|uniref:MmgE/PrpD family protein n=1 Tax=Paraburkholderia silviterrae TaxID=2528715 RepID=A0A4R5M5T8_9BURK|nr:MmgE/PrpD family protein [Paraburkholderia silviterrae]TDG21251.1 MmgE/PrpD family protein [Paraburkholderia silviterrae]